MNIYVSQIYSEPGTSFPFSHLFQKWLGGELSRIAAPLEQWSKKYDEEFSLMLRLNAKKKISSVELRGPTVFKKSKDVEMTIFIPHDGYDYNDSDKCEAPLKLILDGIIVALDSLSINTVRIRSDSKILLKHAIQLDGLIRSS